MNIKFFSKCGITEKLFPLILALFCIAGCLNSPSDQPSASFLFEDNNRSVAEDQGDISDREEEGCILQLNYDVELSCDLLALRGNLVHSGPSPLAYILLNATIGQGKEVKVSTKYLLMQVDPGRECSFEICKNVKISPGEYNCNIEAVGPAGSMACESRRCSLKETAVSSNGEVVAPSVWSEYEERAFWKEIERVTAEVKAAQERSGAADSRKVADRPEDSTAEERLEEENALEESADTGKSSVEGLFIASSSSKKYHRLDCRYALKIKQENRIYFQSAAEAEEKGYLPCKSCNP